MFRNILACLDGSELSEETVRYAADLASPDGVTLHLIRVVAPGSPLVPGAPTSVSFPGGMVYLGAQVADEKLTEHLREAQSYLQERANRLQGDGVEVIQEIRLGEAAQEILSYADDRDIDVIVISTRGISGLRRMVVGSVCDEVIRTANVPVLVVPPPELEESE